MVIDQEQFTLRARVQRRALFWFGLADVLGLAACGDKVYQWREQVLLEDGQTVLVERTAKFSENWVAGGGGGSVNKGMSLRLLPESVKLPPAGAPSAWSDLYVPLVLDRDPKTEEWVIVATFYHCDSWYDLGKPKLPYSEFRYRDGRWTRQALSEHWIGHPANVLPVDLTDKADMTDRQVLTVERKDAIIRASLMSPEFRRVVDRWTTGC